MTARESQTLTDVKDLLQKLVTALVDEAREEAKRKAEVPREVNRMWKVTRDDL